MSVLDRGKTVNAIQSGIQIVDRDGHTSATVVRASDDPVALGVQDFVVIALMEPTLPAIAASRLIWGSITVPVVPYSAKEAVRDACFP